MKRSERALYAKKAQDLVLACIRRRLAAGEPFPSTRTIREETGIASLSTVSKYLHQLEEEGQLQLPKRRYTAPPPWQRSKVVAVQRKRVRLDSGDDLLLSLVAERDEQGNLQLRVAGFCERCGARPVSRRVLSCTDAPLSRSV